MFSCSDRYSRSLETHMTHECSRTCQDQCNVCGAMVCADDDRRTIKGLGAVCVTCFLKEVESVEAGAA